MSKRNLITIVLIFLVDYAISAHSDFLKRKTIIPLFLNRTGVLSTQLVLTANSGNEDSTLKSIVKNTCHITVAEAFTPNNDGVNDYLYPLNTCGAQNLIFKVYDQFANLLFQTTDSTHKWNGTSKGKKTPRGTYVWLVQYESVDTGKLMEEIGSVVLIR